MHKNSQRRFHLDNAVYFITTKTKGNWPFFNNPILCELLIEELRIVQNMRQCLIFGYVIIPDHIHILIYPFGRWNVSQILFTIKKQFAHEANRILGYNDTNPAPYFVGGQTFARLREYINTHHVKGKRFAWQASFNDHIIRDGADLENHINYLMLNPVKHGVVNGNTLYPYININMNAITIFQEGPH